MTQNEQEKFLNKVRRSFRKEIEGLKSNFRTIPRLVSTLPKITFQDTEGYDIF